MPIRKLISIHLTLKGFPPGIMFDRYAGDNKTQLSPERKLYLTKKNEVILPQLNIISFMSGINTDSATKILFPSKTYKRLARALGCSVVVKEDQIPFLKDNKPIIFNGFDGTDRDKTSGIFIHYAVARLKGGIPNPKKRPVLPVPWKLNFTLIIRPVRDVDVEDVRRIFDEGGSLVGLGTFRSGPFGKFELVKFIVKEI